MKMNIKQLFQTTALAAIMLSCDSAQEQSAPTGTNTSQTEVTPAQQAAEDEETKKLILERLAMYSEIDQAVSPGSYYLQDDSPFTIIDFDSADVRISVLLDNPSTYHFIMSRMSQNSKDSSLYDLATLEIQTGEYDHTIMPFYHAAMFYGGKPRQLGSWDNDVATNLKELEIYHQYGSVVTTSSGQAGVDGYNSDRFPSYVEVQSPPGHPYVYPALDKALDVINYYKKGGSEIISIELQQTYFPSAGEREKTAKYVVNMSEPKKEVASAPKP